MKEDRLTIGLSGANFIERYHTFTNTLKSDTFRNTSQARVDFMRFSVSVQYRLGNLRAAVKKVARSILNDDVKQHSTEQNGQSQQ